MLYLYQGLRRGEALLLPANAVQDGYDPQSGQRLFWINVVATTDEDDPRSNKPSIKTSLSQRQIPISPDTVAIIDHYVNNFRGKQKFSHLFCSNQGRPLALSTVNLIFTEASQALHPSSKQRLMEVLHGATVTPHDLRHTCAAARLGAFIESGIETKLAIEKLRSFFGWSPDSDMPLHYSRALVQDRVNSFWLAKHDDRVEFLRVLPRLSTLEELSESPELSGKAGASAP
jgi:integrase